MTDSKSPFRPSFLKIERAQYHLGELERVVQEYLASDPLTVAHTPHDLHEVAANLPEGVVPLFGFSVSMKTSPPPDVMSAIVGDIFHNLRSALDLMASTLAVLNGKSARKVYFPFADSPDELKKQIKDKNFDRAGPEAEKLLWEWAPYTGGNRELRAIHDLNVRDKHRELILQRTLASFTSPIVDTQPDEGGPPKVLHGTETKSLKLAFPNDCSLAEMELISTLHKLVDLTTSIVESFEALGTPPG